jgi:hypothetical protein
MGTTTTTELRTDFTSDTSDLERGTREAADSIGDVAEALDDAGREADLTDRQFEKLADELATMVRRAERAEGKARDLRAELRKVGREAADLDGTDVTVDVHLDTDTDRIRRTLSKIKLERDTLGRGITGALGPVLDNDIAQAVGGAFSAIPMQAQLAIAAIAAVGAAMAAVTVTGLAAGAGLAVVGAWLYRRDPTSPMATAVDEVRDSLSKTATTIANVVQPAFDELAGVLGPVIIDLLHQLNDWLVNNQDTVRKWIIDFAKAFLSAVEVVAYLGKAFLFLVDIVVPQFLWGMGVSAVALGNLIKGIGIIVPGLKGVGDALIDSGHSAIDMSHDIDDATAAAQAALSAIADGAKTAKDGLDKLPGDYDISIGVSFSREFLNLGNRLASVLPRGYTISPTGPAGRAAGDVMTPVVQPPTVINIRVDGGDPDRVAKAVETRARTWGAGVTVTSG